MEISDHLTCVLRNLFAGQEVTVRTGHGTTDWFQIGKGVHQGCILSPCFFFFFEERNTTLFGKLGILVDGRLLPSLSSYLGLNHSFFYRQGRVGGEESESESDVAQLCPTLCNPMDCSLQGFSNHGIFQARVLEWAAISFSVTLLI